MSIKIYSEKVTESTALGTIADIMSMGAIGKFVDVLWGGEKTKHVIDDNGRKEYFDSEKARDDEYLRRSKKK